MLNQNDMKNLQETKALYKISSFDKIESVSNDKYIIQTVINNYDKAISSMQKSINILKYAKQNNKATERLNNYNNIVAQLNSELNIIKQY